MGKIFSTMVILLHSGAIFVRSKLVQSSRLPSLVEGQVSGVWWRNAASYISIVRDPLHVQPMCVPECFRVLIYY